MTSVAGVPMLQASDFAAIGQSLLGEGQEVPAAAAAESAAERRKLPAPETPKQHFLDLAINARKKRLMMYVFLILLTILVIYQTLSQFILKMIENENVLTLISKYLESSPSDLPDFACHKNKSQIDCRFLTEDKEREER